MLLLSRDTERRHVGRGKRDLWLTFSLPEVAGAPAGGFGLLAAFDEMRLSPDQVMTPPPQHEAEVITYVYKGALAQENSTGSSGVVHAGEFQRMTVVDGIRRKETNASRTDGGRIFRISLRPSQVGLDRVYEQKRFAAGQRRNTLCAVASVDGRKGSLHLLRDAIVYSSMLDPGHHLVHELLAGRSAWLHVVHGQVALQDILLAEGDGVGLTSEPVVSFTAQEQTEILLVDLGPTPA